MKHIPRQYENDIVSNAIQTAKLSTRDTVVMILFLNFWCKWN